MRSTAVYPSLLASLLVALSGCGGSDDGDGSRGDGEPSPRRVVAKVLEKPRVGIPADVGQWMVEIGTNPDGELAFTVGEVVAPPGNTNLRLANPQSTEHDLTVEEMGGGSVTTGIISDGSAWLRLSLFEEKRYVFYCSVPGHRAAGMRGTIKVDPQLEADDLEAY